MNKDDSPDARFLRRWQWWHRLGWPLYLLCSVVISAFLTAISVGCIRNLFAHGLTFAAWYGLTRVDYFIVAGAVFGSVTTLLGRFSSNEARYDRLTQIDRKA